MQTLIVVLYVLGFAFTAAGALTAAVAVHRAYGSDSSGQRRLTYENVNQVIEAVSVRGWLYLSLILFGGLLSTIASILSVL